MKKVHFGVPFVVTYHLTLKVLGKIIHKNLNLSLRNEDALTPVPMVCLRIARKLSNYLVTAKLYPLERIVGSRKCN